MRSLVVVGETPVPPTSGFRLRTLHLARQLAGAADVDVLALGPVPNADGEPFRLIGVPHNRSRARALATSLTRPYLAAKVASKKQAAIAHDSRYDTVQVESPFLVPAVAGLRAVVLDAHNLEHEVAASFLTAERRAVPRARWQWEAAKTRRFESAVARAVDAVCVTNATEARTFDAMGATRTLVVPNGVDTASIAYGPPAASAAVIYVGHFGYRPNAAAAIELADEILPRVARRVPTVRLTMVGREPGSELLRRAAANVTVTGEVESVTPYLAASRVLVVPLRAGSGTRLKILEAMAVGVPVVSTRLGAHGLDLTDGHELLLGETPDELAEQAVRVLTDDALAGRLSQSGRAAVERTFDWSIVARPLVALHAELAGSSG